MTSIPVAWPIPRVGVIGVGQMGSAIVARLLSKGYLVAVHDIDAQCEAQAVGLGAMACATATGLASSSEVVIVAVADAAQVHAVLFGPHGAVASLAPGSAVMLCATIAPADTERVVAGLAPLGIDWFDAPLSGGPESVREGSTPLTLACTAAAFDKHRELIEVLSSKFFRISERPGDGARMKLVNDLLAAVNLAGAAEALALAERLGLSVARTLAVIEQSSGHSWIGSDRMRRAMHGDYLPRAPTQQLNKDAQLALGMAQEAGMTPRVGEQAAALFARACDNGLAAMDDASVFELLRRR